MDMQELKDRINEIEMHIKQLHESFLTMQGQRTECQLWLSKIEAKANDDLKKQEA